MLEEIQFKSTDILYILGDVIHREPDGVEILRDMMGRPNVPPCWGITSLPPPCACVWRPWRNITYSAHALDFEIMEERIWTEENWLERPWRS